MFVRLTGQKRAKAGRFVALIYLLCVLAPGLALALGGDAPWLPAEIKPVAAAHAHGGSFDARHLHTNVAAHEQGGMPENHPADAGYPGHDHDGKTSSAPCCAMLCLSAIPATLPVIAKPPRPMFACVAENYRRMPQAAPPLLYRPPIAMT